MGGGREMKGNGTGEGRRRGRVEGLYCKRPIQCLASSKILTSRPLTARRVCTTPLSPAFAFGARVGHTRWVKRGWGVNILEDVRYCSVLYIRKYFVRGRNGMSSRGWREGAGWEGEVG
jgi:hypothetical protein